VVGKDWDYKIVFVLQRDYKIKMIKEFFQTKRTTILVAYCTWNMEN